MIAAAAPAAIAPLPRWKPATWGVGQIAVQVYRDIPSLLLLFYMTQLLAIPPATAGLAIFLPKLVWSTVCDYLVGTLSDRFGDRVPRRYLMLVGAALLPIALVALFLPPDSASATGRALHVSLWLVAYVTIFSIFSVPHLSIGVEMSSDPRGQSRVMAWRTGYIGVGLLVGAGLAPWLIQWRGGGAEGYRVMSLVMAGACSLALLVAFLGSREPPRAVVPAGGPGKWLLLVRNRPFLFMLAAFFAQMIGQGAAYATLTYLVVFKLAVPSPFVALSVSVLLTSVAVMLVQPLLVGVIDRFGSRRTFMVGTVLYSSSLAWMALGPEGSLISFYLGSIALGLTNSITLQSVFTRLSETVADDASRHGGPSNAGFFASLFVASDKIAFALGGTLLAGVLLALVGFRAGSDIQSEAATSGIALIFSMTPALFNLLAIALMSRSRLAADA